jgi:two-component system cell cycle sensor histidine kinase/response regulator CckA
MQASLMAGISSLLMRGEDGILYRLLSTPARDAVGSRFLRDLLGVVSLAAIYFIAGHLGLRLAFVHSSATAVWPPSGIALATLLVLGYRVWPGILIGAYLVNVTTAGSVATSVGIAAGNTLEGVLGAYLVNRFAGGRQAFDRARDFFKFVLLASLGSPAVSATVGVTSLSLGGFARWPDFGPIWLTWWLGDAVSILVVAPLLVLGSSGTPVPWRRRQMFEAATLMVSLFLVGQAVFGGLTFKTKNYPLEFVCIPFLLWVALRLGRRLVAIAIFELAAIAIWGTTRGFGPFVEETQNESLLLLQAYIGVVAVMSMAVATLVRERQGAEAALRSAHDELELRVRERTAALSGANAALATEMAERQGIEEQLRKSEEEYHLLFDRNPHPMWVFDAETLAFLAVNDAAVHHYGYSREELLGMTIDEIRPPEDVPPPDPSMPGQSAEPPMSTAIGLSRHRKKDGTVIQVDVASTPIGFRGRKARLVLAVDVMEKRNLEAQLLQSQKMEVVGRLAGGIAHDFNNLLGVITGYGELLRNRLDDARLRKYADDILKAAERAAALTQQLLAFSRKQVQQPRILNLNFAVEHMDGMLRRLIGEDIQLVTVLKDVGPIKADQGQVDQVLMNLVINARDAMPNGGRLVVETDAVDLDEGYARLHGDVRPGPYVMLAVTDTGHGMTPEVKARLFEPFFTTKEAGKGTGLGLATVHGIVKQSGGHVFVYSEPGAGTTFKVYFPQAAPSVDSGPSGVEEEAPRGDETILVVEDEAALREITRECLENRGYTVLEAAHGMGALELSQVYKAPIHLLITDVIMPGLTGRELAQRLTAERPEMKVIYMSGYTDDAVIRRGVLAEETPFVQKPFTAAHLDRKVREVLDGRGVSDTVGTDPIRRRP